VVNRHGYHGIRVRNYEADLSEVRVPLDEVLGPVGIRRVEGEVAGIDLRKQAVTVITAGGQRILSYDRLVFALGSQVLRPNVPGLAEHGFDVDTYEARPGSIAICSRSSAGRSLQGSGRSSSWAPA